MAVYAHRQSAPKVSVPEDLREMEMFQDPSTVTDRYERSLLEAVKKKKLKSDRMNRRRIKAREKRAKERLTDLFK